MPFFLFGGKGPIVTTVQRHGLVRTGWKNPIGKGTEVYDNTYRPLVSGQPSLGNPRRLEAIGNDFGTVKAVIELNPNVKSGLLTIPSESNEQKSAGSVTNDYR